MKDKAAPERTGRSPIAIILYIAAAAAALVGIALLIDNIYIYKTTLDQYVAQGYPAAEVKKSIIPAQLLPGIFDPVGVYGGIALILLGVGKANKMLSKFMAAQAGAEGSKRPEAEIAALGQTDTEEKSADFGKIESAAEQTVGEGRADSEGLEFVEPENKDLP